MNGVIDLCHLAVEALMNPPDELLPGRFVAHVEEETLAEIRDIVDGPQLGNSAAQHEEEEVEEETCTASQDIECAYA